jgi:hypothetical protein
VLKAEDDRVSSASWILLYRASLSGYRAADFHRACDGMGKCENRRMEELLQHITRTDSPLFNIVNLTT